MATNFEFYKDEILKVLTEQPHHGFSIKNGKLASCAVGNCFECDFHGEGCWKTRIEWLYSEYKPQPKLTKKERLFCELVETGWIARDKTECLTWFRRKPSKSIIWCCDYGRQFVINSCSNALNINFSFIQWSDTEPWAVEDLLKLGVEENGNNEN